MPRIDREFEHPLHRGPHERPPVPPHERCYEPTHEDIMRKLEEIEDLLRK